MHTPFMRRALRLAANARGQTSPNPPVGAVVVLDSVVVGEGWHKGPGRPHAEVEALAQAGERARGAVLFVTLAPCTRFGRTPPCTPAVIAAGVSTVVIGVADPNPQEVSGSIAELRAAGIEVVEGVLADEAALLIQGFSSLVTRGRPLVTVKIAATLDGRVAAADGSSRWITGPGARRDGHRLRGWSDAVLVGSQTAIKDNPALTCRLRGFSGRQPLRVVLDSAGRVPLDSAVFDHSAPTLIATTSKAPDEFVDAARERGADVIRIDSRDGHVDLHDLLPELARRSVADLLVEGGPTVIGELHEHRLIDRFVFYVAPKLLGQLGVPAIAGLMIPNIQDAYELTITGVHRVGADIKIEARPRP